MRGCLDGKIREFLAERGCAEDALGAWRTKFYRNLLKFDVVASYRHRLTKDGYGDRFENVDFDSLSFRLLSRLDPEHFSKFLGDVFSRIYREDSYPKTLVEFLADENNVRWVERAASRCSGGNRDALDMCQEVYERWIKYRYIERFNPIRSRWSTYIFISVRSTVYTALARQRRDLIANSLSLSHIPDCSEGDGADEHFSDMHDLLSLTGDTRVMYSDRFGSMVRMGSQLCSPVEASAILAQESEDLQDYAEVMDMDVEEVLDDIEPLKDGTKRNCGELGESHYYEEGEKEVWVTRRYKDVYRILRAGGGPEQVSKDLRISVSTAKVYCWKTKRVVREVTSGVATEYTSDQTVEEFEKGEKPEDAVVACPV